MVVTIGIDPHKGSHTAVALDEHEATLGQLRVRSGPDQLARLCEWAKAWPERTWAVENASGSATSSPSNSSPPARGCSTSRPSWLPARAARQRRDQQERPQRRPFCRRGRHAGETPARRSQERTTPR